LSSKKWRGEKIFHAVKEYPSSWPPKEVSYEGFQSSSFAHLKDFKGIFSRDGYTIIGLADKAQIDQGSSVSLGEGGSMSKPGVFIGLERSF
jgi:hypothetical protein